MNHLDFISKYGCEYPHKVRRGQRVWYFPRARNTGMTEGYVSEVTDHFFDRHYGRTRGQRKEYAVYFWINPKAKKWIGQARWKTPRENHRPLNRKVMNNRLYNGHAISYGEDFWPTKLLALRASTLTRRFE